VTMPSRESHIEPVKKRGWSKADWRWFENAESWSRDSVT
jgi:hypothetical protein